ncbi:MAG TPA: hypothetical protein VFW85_11015 [Gaiellaceae bacterium]|nr:hypothetical protein [Gaiellaceae bacterium]
MAARTPGGVTASVSVLVVSQQDAHTGRARAAIEAQEGVRPVDIAVLEVPPGTACTFDHAAELASGELLVVLAEDAVLLGTHSLAALAKVLDENPKVAAASPREVPASSAELAACWRAFARERMVDRVWTQRSCVAIRRAVWSELGGDSADFGVRAAAAGREVVRAPDAAVAHSRALASADVFRGCLVDRLERASVASVAESPADALNQCRRLVADLSGALVRLAASAPLAHQLWTLRDGLTEDAAPGQLSGELAELDALLARGAEDGVPAYGRVRGEYLELLSSPSLELFARAHASVAAEDAARFAGSLLASTAGRVVGDALRTSPDVAVARSLGV